MQSGSFLKTSAALLAAGPGSLDDRTAPWLTASLQAGRASESLHHPRQCPQGGAGSGARPRQSVLLLLSSLLPPFEVLGSGFIQNHGESLSV